MPEYKIWVPYFLPSKSRLFLPERLDIWKVLPSSSFVLFLIRRFPLSQTTYIFSHYSIHIFCFLHFNFQFNFSTVFNANLKCIFTSIFYLFFISKKNIYWNYLNHDDDFKMHDLSRIYVLLRIFLWYLVNILLYIILKYE